MVGVGVGTAALIIILSVFNGLNDLIRQQYNLYNPEIKIIPSKGKVFKINTTLLDKIQAVEGVQIITEVIEDDAVLKYRNAQMIGKIKGVSDSFLAQSGIPSALLGGEFQLRTRSAESAVVGIGVASILSLNLADVFPLEVWYPERKRKVSISERDIRKESIRIVGAYSIEYEHDQKYVITPLSFAQRLMDYDNERSALEIKVSASSQINRVKNGLIATLGDQFIVQNQEEQQAGVFRALKIEKLFAYLILSFVLAMASLNTFFSLSMLALEKKKDIAILLSMGASRQFIRQIFLKEGALVTFVGASIGLLLGGGIVWIQQTFGLVQMGMQTSIVEAYPVKLIWTDFLFTGLIIIGITLAIAYLPAQRATQNDIKKHL